MAKSLLKIGLDFASSMPAGLRGGRLGRVLDQKAGGAPIDVYCTEIYNIHQRSLIHADEREVVPPRGQGWVRTWRLTNYAGNLRNRT
jgi:hypothetical protein